MTSEDDKNALPFTGERYVPELEGQIALEHFHRYMIARDLATGKAVLDIACGEGYGSSLLADVAAQVIGVDIDAQSVHHARARYQAPNIEFRVGSAAEIPLADASVDIVVSFETIEHHDQHEKMMQEVKRILKPGGQLIISSPDKQNYSIGPNYVNPYHVKELFVEDFRALLKQHFRHYTMLGQRVVYGSVLAPLDDHAVSFESLVGVAPEGKKYSGLAYPIYEFAIASDAELPRIKSSLFEIPPKAGGNTIRNRLRRKVKEWRGKLIGFGQRFSKKVLNGFPRVHSLNLNRSVRFIRRILLTPIVWPADITLPNIVRKTWQRLPIPVKYKQNVKDTLFKKFPFVFYRTQSYRNWSNSNITNINPAAGRGSLRTPPQQLVGGEYTPLLNAQPLSHKPVKLISFYLPQFHPIHENNEWWGEGFTEWTKVRPAQPQFDGHYQPREPGELGYYNLLDPAIQRRQVELAKLYGIEGFCFYFYWFGGKRLLETPIENYLKDSRLDLPFCLCWANENWTRRWDGKDDESLIVQEHSPEDDLAFIQHVASYMRDPRYIRIDGKPLLLLYRLDLLPSANATARRWRDWCRDNGIGEIYLTCTESFAKLDPGIYGFDATVEFPPNNSGPPDITKHIKPVSTFEGTVYDWQMFADQSENYEPSAYKLFRSVCPGWDNTARRGSSSTVFINNTPILYRHWLGNAIRDTVAHQDNPDERLVFINAWNEWAEGAYLEPDARTGYAFLQATRDALCDTGAVQGGQILLVTHDCHPHGAQFLTLEMARRLKLNGFKVSILALGSGKLFNDFCAIGQTVNAEEAGEQGVQKFLVALRAEGAADAITSTVVSGSILPKLKDCGFRVLSLIHELPNVIREMHQEENAATIVRLADKVVFPAEMVRDHFCNLVPVAPEKIIIRPQGLLRKNPYRHRRAEAHAEICKKHGLPADTQIILSIAYVDARKGPDRFVEIAAQILQQRPNTTFIWVGHADLEMKRKVDDLIRQFGIQDRVIFTGFDANPMAYYAAAEVYALTSREDPFPNVVLESAEAGAPVVAFQDATGAADFIVAHDGRLAADTDDFARQICDLLENPSERMPNHVGDMQQYVLDLLHHLNGMPRISVVVPNYNYSRHIVERLDSISHQTFPIYELIVLDDASSDNSVEVIQKYFESRDLRGQVIVNDHNSGSVQRQWHKGLTHSRGDFVWIAEADDVADGGFISELVPVFIDPDVVLAFTQSRQIDENGRILALDYLAYTGDISDRWRAHYIRDGIQEIREALAIKNTLPNVSAVLFRREALEKAFAAIGSDLFAYRVAGDWLVYLYVLMQGKLYYSEKSLNSHRRHTGSITGSLEAAKHLEEVCQLQEIARSLTAPSGETLDQASAYIDRLYEHFGIAKKESRNLKNRTSRVAAG